MPIYSLQDLRATAPENLRNAPDEVLLTEYSKSVGADPAAVAKYLGYGQSGGMAANRVSAGIDNYQANLYGLGGAVSRAVGAEDTAQWFDQRRVGNEFNAALAAQRARDLGAVDDWRDVGGVGDAFNYVGGLAAQSLPYLGEAAAGALTGGLALGPTALRMGLTRGAASMAGAAAASYPSAVGDVLSAQRDAGGENLGTAMVGGVPYAALNALGVEGLVARGLRPIAAAEGPLMRRMATGAATTALGEGVSETGQEGVNQYFGRMAVDPNETFFNEEANRRYLDSFVGGAALGGVFGGVGGMRRPVQENQPYDLTKRNLPEEPPLGLGYSPLAGTPIVFPDGSVALNGEQELAKRYGTVPDFGAQEAAAEQPAAAAAPAPSAVFTPQEQRLLDMGIKATGNRVEQATRVLDAMEVAGLPDEQQFVVTELMKGGAIPGAQKALDLFVEAQKYGLTDEQLEVVRQAAMAREFATAKKKLADLIADVRREAAVAPKQQNVSNVGGAVAPTLPAGAPVAAGVSSTPAPSAVAPVAPAAAGIQASTPPAPVSDSQPTDLVQRRKKRVVDAAALKQSQAFVAPESTIPYEVIDQQQGESVSAEDQAFIGEMTGGNVDVRAQLEEEAGARSDATAVVGDDLLPRLLAERFKGSKNAARDTEIATAYITAVRAAPKGSKIKIQEAIGTKYGIKPVAVRKIGNVADLVRAGAAIGMGEAEVRAALEVNDTAKTTTQAKPDEEAQATDDRQLTEGLRAAGVESVDGETAGFGFDDSRTWSAPEDTAEAKANAVQSIMDQQERLRATMEEMESQGQLDVAGEINAQIEALDAKLQALIAEYASYLEGNKAKKAATKKSSAVKTPSESARDAWDKVARTYDGAPSFDELPKDVQERWVEYGEDNWGESDVAIELARIQREGGAPTELARRGQTFFDLGEAADVLPGLEQVVQDFQAAGISNALDFISDWVLVDEGNYHGMVRAEQGRYVGYLNTDILTNPQYAAEVARHELGHAVDMALHGGVYSGQPEMSVRMVNGRVVPTGAVARELFALYKNDENWRKFLEYPFDTGTFPELDNSVKVESELFAQIFAVYTNARGKAEIERVAPATAAYLKEVINDIKSTKSLQVQKAETAAKRTLAFRDRGQPQSDRRPGGVSRQAAVGEGLASKSAQFQALNDRLPEPLRQPVNATWDALQDFGSKALDRVMFTSDLVDRAAKMGLKSANRFAELLGKRGAKARELESRVERIADMFALVPDHERQKVNTFLFESTRQGKWGYGKYRDASMGETFDALSKPAREFIQAVFKHGDDVLAQKKRTVLDNTASEYDAMIAAETDEKAKAKLEKDKADTLKRFERLFQIREGMPYAPIKRMGTYVVIARSPEYRAAEEAGDAKKLRELEQSDMHYHVSFTDTKGEARALAQQLQAEPQFADGVVFREREKFRDEMFGGDGVLKALGSLRAKIEAGGGKGSSQMLRAISELYLEALAENSARKSEMRRRGIAGDVDMLRSFTAQGRADATFMSGIEFGQDTREVIQKMSGEVRRAVDQTRASELYNELMARYVQSMDVPETPWINKLTRATSIWFLASSPAYYLQNLTQPWMMSLPAMAGRHNYAKVASLLGASYGDLKDVMKSAKLFSQSLDFDKVSKNPDEQQAIRELVNRGKIDIGMETELGEFRVDSKSAAGNFINRIDKGMRLAVQKVESLNRLTTALTAYRLERQAGRGHEQALAYAERILNETHGDYTRFNAPRAFNTAWGKVALQFRKFQLIQLSFYAKLLRDAFTNPAERAVALKTLGYSLAHTGAMAGLMGLPGYAAIAWLLGAALGDDDEPFDLTEKVRELIGDEQLATMILRGAPTLGGADLSGKVGSGNMLSIMPFSNADLTTTAGITEAFGTLAGGASLGLVARGFDGANLMLGGDWYKGMEKMLPKGLGDAMKAYRINQDGLTKRNGDVLLPADEVSAVESAMQAIGFMPADQAVTYERRDRAYKLDEQLKGRSSDIKRAFTEARRKGDAQAMAEARQEWQALQEARRRQGFKVQPMSELLKAPQEAAKRQRNTAGGIQYDTENRAYALRQSSM